MFENDGHIHVYSHKEGCKIGQGQPRVIIRTNNDGPKFPIFHSMFQGHRPFGSIEDDFKGFCKSSCSALYRLLGFCHIWAWRPSGS